MFVPFLQLFNLFLFSWGVATLAGTAVVFFRDLQHLIGVAIRASFYTTPIIVPIDLIPDSVRGLFLLNPLYYIVAAFGAPIVDGTLPEAKLLVISSAVAWTTFIGGWVLLRKCEDAIMFRL